MSQEQPTHGPAYPVEMDLKEFRDGGYLQEINRRFLHPLGLALAMAVENETRKPTGIMKVWDAREDPEGFIFETWERGDSERGEAIEQELCEGLAVRQERLGYGVQPLPPTEVVARD